MKFSLYIKYRNSKIFKKYLKLIKLNVYISYQAKIYKKWLNGLPELSNEILTEKKYNPLISIVTPVYKTPISYLEEMIESVISQKYFNWELILIDDHSNNTELTDTIKNYVNRDKRIRYYLNKKNLGIAETTNKGFNLSKGEFIALLDHDDLIYPNTLEEVAKALNYNKDLKFIFTDEDKISANSNKRYDPFFKPGWNPDFLHSVNYITHFSVIEKKLLLKLNGESKEYDGAQDWELFLRITRTIKSEEIYHIPKILYSWRSHINSTSMSLSAKPYVIQSQQAAIKSDLKARDIKNVKVKNDIEYEGQWRLDYFSRGSVCVYTDNKNTEEEIRRKTDHNNLTIRCVNQENLIIKDILNNNSFDFVVFAYSKINVLNSNWLHQAIGDASRREVGFVIDCNREERLLNYSYMIDSKSACLLKKFKGLSITNHLLNTVKYNICIFREGIATVELKKLYLISEKNLNKNINLLSLSQDLCERGLHNLTNPYLKISK